MNISISGFNGQVLSPISALEKEHQLIERMIILLRKQSMINGTESFPLVYLNFALDFFEDYADRAHHNKEEHILIRKMARKNLSKEDILMVRELLEGHLFSRKALLGLAESRDKLVWGRPEYMKIIRTQLSELLNFYQAHIRMENRFFFPGPWRF